MSIYNCHTHTFTIENVPEDFVPLKLGKLYRHLWLRKPITFILKNLWPFGDDDMLERYIRYANLTYNKSQADIFELLLGYYPPDAKFVVLALDMEFMGAGKVPQSFVEQHQELDRLRDKYPNRLIPFVAVDPRRNDILAHVINLVENKDFKGIKLYPSLGFYPCDPKLEPVYEYAQQKDLPIISHCTKGGIYYKGEITADMLTNPCTGKKLEKTSHKQFAANFADPDNYLPVLEKFPKLKLSLAHFGGATEWDAFLHHPWYPNPLKPQEKSWFAKIMDIIRSGQYPNFYTDISYTLHKVEYFPLLKVVLENPLVKEKVLFGTDFYMVEQQVREREFALRLRAYLGEELFGQIATQNPARFLGVSG